MKLLLASLSFMLIMGCSQNLEQQDPLTALLSKDAEFKRAIDPSQDSIFNRLPDASLAAHKEKYEFNKELLNQLQLMDKNELSRTDQISYDLLKFTKENALKEFEFNTHLNPLLVDYGFHTGFVSTARSYEFKDKDSYDNYIHLLLDFPRFVKQHIDLMKQGLEQGICQSQIIFDGYEITYDNHIVDDPTESIFYLPFLQLPDYFSQEEKDTLIARAKSSVTNGAVKGYQIFSDFMTNEYIPKTRKNTGALNLPNGESYYAYLIKKFTTLELSADSIHQLGLAEVSRIRNEMNQIIESVGFEGTYAEFLHFLRTDPQFYAQSADELMKEATYISKKMDGQLPKLFGKLPRQPYTVTPVPEHLAPKYTAGRYSGAPIESTHAGEYWVNTYDLKTRTLYTLEALSFHEAVPGHHLQGALNQELDIPEFRQNLYLSAFGEGWGLYSEFLGIEAGFYQDPYSDFGRLTYEMWRACRLVVDTGIHQYGWSRERVLEYMGSNTALSLHEIRTETDRYISWPGQALSYKIGELKIKALRNKVEEELGDKFDIREFHDLILEEGTVTLPILQKQVDLYLERKKS